MMVPVGELLSDLPPLENTGALVANNVIPAARSYRPLKALGTVGGALTARAQGAFTARSAALVLGNFAGDVAKLYKYNGSTEVWDDVTRSAGGAYTTAATDVWNFTQFGDVVIAVNGTDAIQEYTLGSSTLFAALGGSPPVAKYITVIKDFVIIGNIASAGNRVRWSATGNAASWAVSAATQADLQDLYIGGQVQGLVGGEFGVVFQENAIRRMTYVGSPIIFQFDEVSRDLGCDLPGSIASYQNVAFFHSADGFKSIIGGSQIQDIGANKIDRTFAMDLDIANASRVTSTIDRQNKLYIVSYPGVGNTGGTPNRLAIYNFQTGWWAFADVEAELIYSAAQQTGYTLDTLDDISS